MRNNKRKKSVISKHSRNSKDYKSKNYEENKKINNIERKNNVNKSYKNKKEDIVQTKKRKSI